jgi:hypothetical protein
LILRQTAGPGLRMQLQCCLTAQNCSQPIQVSLDYNRYRL